MSFLGRSLRNRFPLWSETRRNESSNAAILLDSIGSSIEEERVSLLKNLKSTFSLEGNPTPELGHFFRFTQLNQEYQNFRKNNNLFESFFAEGTIEGETFYLEPKYSYEEMVLSDPTRHETLYKKLENVKLFSIVEDESSLDPNDSHFYFLKSKENKVDRVSIQDTFDFKNDYKKIYIKIEKSKLYRSLKDSENFNGHHSIILRGEDETREIVEETIEIIDDGIYTSKTWFKNLSPQLEENDYRGGGSIEIYGFVGDIKFYTAPIENTFYINRNSIIGKISNELGYDTLSENNIKYSLTHEEINNETVSFLNHNFCSYEFGSEYKDSTATLDGDYFEETLSKRAVIDENLNPIKVDSFTMDVNRNKLVTIGKDFIIREHSPYRDSFNLKLISRTKEVDLAFETENQRVFLMEESKMNLFLERAKSGIQFLFIGRHSPERRLSYEDGSDFNFEFLQSDLSWGDGFEYFEGKYADNIYEEFDSMQFDCEYTELGQYDYYVYCFKNFSVTREYLNKVKTGVIEEKDFKTLTENIRRAVNQNDLTINSYSVLCEEASPSFLLSLDKESILNQVKQLEGISIDPIQPAVIHGDLLQEDEELNDFINTEEYTLSIWFENIQNNLYISINYADRHYIFEVERYYDYIFYDYDSGTGVTIEEYDEINITVNGEYENSITRLPQTGFETLEKIRNSTWIDEVGFAYGTSRELNESLNQYRHRVVCLMKGTLKKEKDSFYKSLGYITSMRDIDIFRIVKKDPEESIDIEISSNRIHIYRNETLFYTNRFENIKFLKDLYDVLITFDFLEVEVLEEGESWWYKKTENLMPASSKRQKIRVDLNTQSKKISEKYIKSIKDLNGDFLNEVSEEQVVSPHNYSISNGVLHKYKLGEEPVTYSYENFPFILKWLPIKACPVTDVDFDDLLKTSFYDNETYGEINNSEEKETEKLLSQKGSVIINKILAKQNTYWGE